MDGMDYQVSGAASDNADVIIIELGTNDNNSGDLQALQMEAEENITELMISNPNADIYYLNILPAWGPAGNEWSKNNIRSSINSVCMDLNITCWDTYSDPWIEFSDTLDGVHPNAAGHQKIAIKVKSLLE